MGRALRVYLGLFGVVGLIVGVIIIIVGGMILAFGYDVMNRMPPAAGPPLPPP